MYGRNGARLYQDVETVAAQAQIHDALVVDTSVFHPLMYREILLQVPEVKFSAAAITTNFRLQNESSYVCIKHQFDERFRPLFRSLRA